MQTPQMFTNALKPDEAGGIAGGAYGALQAAPQYYKQMQESKFMGPLLQALLMQKQQKALQMQAETPFAGQLAQNTSLGMLPMGVLAQMMESNRLSRNFPFLQKELGGFTGGEFGGYQQPPQSTTPTPSANFGALNARGPNGQVTQPGQQQTWMGNLGNSIKNLGMGAVGLLEKGFHSLNPMNNSQAVSSAVANTNPTGSSQNNGSYTLPTGSPATPSIFQGAYDNARIAYSKNKNNKTPWDKLTKNQRVALALQEYNR